MRQHHDGGRDARPMTPVYSDKVAFDLDQVQYDLGDGPCSRPSAIKASSS